VRACAAQGEGRRGRREESERKGARGTKGMEAKGEKWRKGMERRASRASRKRGEYADGIISLGALSEKRAARAFCMQPPRRGGEGACIRYKI